MLHVWDIYLHLGDFLGQMLVNIPYMEHLGYNPLSEPSDFLCISLWSRPLSSSSRNNVAVDPVPFATWTAYDWGVAAIYIYMYIIYIYWIVPPYTNSHQNPVYIYNMDFIQKGVPPHLMNRLGDSKWVPETNIPATNTHHINISKDKNYQLDKYHIYYKYARCPSLNHLKMWNKYKQILHPNWSQPLNSEPPRWP